MGYDVGRLKDGNELSDDFLCKLCDKIIESPLMVNADCEHIFCGPCINPRLNQNINKCPIDDYTIDEPNLKRPPLYWLRKYENLMVYCYYNHKGCKEIKAIRELAIHEVNCEYNPDAIISCDRNCGASFTRKDGDKHSCLPYLKSLIDGLKGVTPNPRLGAQSSQRGDANSKIDELKLLLNKTQDELNKLKANPVPIGFTYLQLPRQPEPSIQWPNVQWTDISADYGGLFFRVLGGESALFGQIQGESSPKLQSVEADLIDEEISMIKINVPPNGEWSDYIHSDIGNSGGGSERVSLRFKMSTDEVRPRNQAIRVWKRTA